MIEMIEMRIGFGLKISGVLIVIGILLLAPTTALEIKSGGQVLVDQPKGDLLVSGGRVIVESSVRDLIVAGGEIDVLGDVKGDLIAAGGRVDVKGDVNGKVIVAGGSVRIDGKVGRFVVATAGEFSVGENSETRDVLVFGGKIENHGIVNGNLTAIGGSYQNFGVVKGAESFKETRFLPPYFSEIVALGFLLMGLLLLWFDESIFARVNSELKVGGKELVKRLILGFLGMVVVAVIVGLLFVSLVGIPIAAVILSAFVIAILLANLFVAYSIGEVLISSKRQNAYLYLILGFVILYIAFKLPYVGGAVRIVTTSLGFAGTAYVFNDWRESRRGESKQIDKEKA